VPLDVHLMIEEPERYVDAFCDAGADYVTVHVEACIPLHRVIEQIRSRGKHPGIALNPGTSEETLRYSIERVDLVLVMTVSPGFAGQSFIRSVIPKITAIRMMINASGGAIELAVKGGLDPTHAEVAARAGARVLVSGNAVFALENCSQAIGALRTAGKRGAAAIAR
jgi:ribulose-phosphate 3-epimerase